MSDDDGIDVEFEFIPEDGNVRTIMVVGGCTLRFVASPTKIRQVAAAMERAAQQADDHLPGGFDHGDLVT